MLKRIKFRYIVLLGLIAFMLFNGSLYGLIHNKRELSKLKKQSSELDEEYVRLVAELARLESADEKYLEEVARGKYHMSKPGEIEFRF